MPIGVTLQLFDGANPQANLSGITARWWDEAEPADLTDSWGITDSATTDANGNLTLDLTHVTWLNVGDYGFLMLYKKDDTNSQDSLVFSGKVQTSTITSGTVLGFGLPYVWDRPSDWLTLPTAGPTEEKFVGLLAVFDHESNHIAFTAAGSYTVDWGDGSATEDIASGVLAQHVYSYASLGVGTICSRGYKQAVVTVTPQAGQALSSVNLQKKYGTSQGLTCAWLDIRLGSPNLTSLMLGASTYPGTAGYTVSLAYLESVELVSHSLPTAIRMFNGLSSLAQVILPPNSTFSDTSYMFNGCTSLKGVPPFSSQNMASLFYGCYSLERIPLLGTSSTTSMADMFNSCMGLTKVPLLETPQVTTMNGMFNQCFSLKRITIQSMPNVVSAASMFYDCRSLEYASLGDTTSLTTTSGMFGACYALKSFTISDTSKVSDMSNMFTNCYSLTDIAELDTSNVANMSNMFSYASALLRIPSLNTPKVTNTGSMFLGCTNLESILFSDTSLVTAFSNAFFLTSCLSKLRIPGWKQTYSFANMNFGPDALNQIYTDLATVTAKTITVSGNWGTASDNPAIATAKGWTVTG